MRKHENNEAQKREENNSQIKLWHSIRKGSNLKNRGMKSLLGNYLMGRGEGKLKSSVNLKHLHIKKGVFKSIIQPQMACQRGINLLHENRDKRVLRDDIRGLERGEESEMARTATKTVNCMNLPLSSLHTHFTHSRTSYCLRLRRTPLHKKAICSFPLTQIHIEIGPRTIGFRLRNKFIYK